MLKVNPAVADVTVIVPVATKHVGCVTTAVAIGLATVVTDALALVAVQFVGAAPVDTTR